MENLYDTFYKELQETTSPGSTLANFYRTLFDIKDTKYLSNIKMFSKLVKLYGREVVFHAIVETYDIDNLTHDNLYPLFTYLCKRISETKSSKYREISLEDMAKNLEVQFKRNKEIKRVVRNPFNE